MANSKEPPKNQVSVQIILIVGLLILIILVCVFGTLMILTLQNQNPSGAVNSQNGAVSSSQGKAGTAESPGEVQKVAEGMFEMSMNTSWTFPTDKKASNNAYVANAENNRYSFSIDVTIDDTGQSVYHSEIIPVGGQIKEIKLSEPLAAGDYAATCTYTMYDDDGEEGDSFAVGISISVLK